MNKVKVGSQMYQFLNENGNRGYTWNVIKGECPHDCSYCYMKRFSQPELHLDVREFKTDLGKGNFIFVGSSCDMWAEGIDAFWIDSVLKHCRDNDVHNKYLFQSKNPDRFQKWLGFFPDDTILGTTIETNRDYAFLSKAPVTYLRKVAMKNFSQPNMVSIEPIMDFDLDVLLDWIREIAPVLVSIGADSKGHSLPEPPPDKVQRLIEELQGFTTVKIKNNLKRLVEAK